jgi:hypothetical protein
MLLRDGNEALGLHDTPRPGLGQFERVPTSIEHHEVCGVAGLGPQLARDLRETQRLIQNAPISVVSPRRG